MDAFTLTVASALAGTIMCCSMGLLYLASSRRVCLFDWALAGLFFALNMILGACALKYGLKHFLVPAFGNMFYIAGHYGVLAGLRRHLGLGPRWDILAVLASAVFCAHLVPAVQASVVCRVALFTPAIVLINLSAAWLLWRHPARETRLSFLPMIVLELFFLAQQSLRALLIVYGERIDPAFVAGHDLQTWGTLFVLVFLSVATMSCALIVTHDQALALKRASLTDVLTGWLNRRALHDIATRAFRRTRRGSEAIHFITFDIDYFKSINDRYGHGVGDAAICHVTRLAANALRGNDALFRIGGEEFAVLVSGSSLPHVRGIAGRLRELVAASKLDIDGHQVRMTVSVGVAALGAGDGKWEDILRRADEALYHAKQHGRNRVSVHGVDLPGWQAGPRAQAMAG